MDVKLWMDVLGDLLLLGVDVAVFAFCYKMFHQRSENYRLLKEVPILRIDSQLQGRIQESGGKIPYAAITGVVRTSQSFMHLAKQTVDVSTGQTGMRSELCLSPPLHLWYSTDDIKQLLNTVPFMLSGKSWWFGTSTNVKMIDLLRLKILTLPYHYREVISCQDVLEETIVGWFRDSHWHDWYDAVSRLKYEVLGNLACGGSTVTGIGELVIENGEIRLQPPSIPGASYFLTTLPFDTLMRKLNLDSHIFKQLSMIMGCIGALLFIHIATNIQRRKSCNKSHP